MANNLDMIDRALAKAQLYRLVLSGDLFGATSNPLALEVLEEIRTFVRGQMGALVGQPSTGPVESTFTPEQVVALKRVADRLLGNPELIPPTPVANTAPVATPEAPKKRGRPKKVVAEAPAAPRTNETPRLAQIAVPESLNVPEAVVAAAPAPVATPGQERTYSAANIKVKESAGTVNPRLEELAKRVGGFVKGNRVLKQRIDEETGEPMWEQIGDKLVPFYQEFYLPAARPPRDGPQPTPMVPQDVPGGNAEAALIAAQQADATTKSFNQRIGRGGDLRANAEVVRGDSKPKTASDIINEMTASYGVQNKE